MLSDITKAYVSTIIILFIMTFVSGYQPRRAVITDRRRKLHSEEEKRGEGRLIPHHRLLTYNIRLGATRYLFGPAFFHHRNYRRIDDAHSTSS